MEKKTPRIKNHFGEQVLSIVLLLFCMALGDQESVPTPPFCMDYICDDSETTSLSQRICSCSQECVLTGTCCLNANVSIATEGETREWVCVKTSKEISSSGYLFRSSCPRRWNNWKVERNCASDGNKNSDAFLRIPVTSKTTNITYKNVFCAICHDDLEIQAWEVYYDCSATKCNVTSLKEAAEMCEEYFNFPFGLGIPLSTLKTCDIYKEDCPMETPREILEKCHMYIYPVLPKEGGLMGFRNHFCASCNGVNPLQLNCFRKIFYYPYDDPSIIIPLPTPLFPTLVDFNFQATGSVVGHIRQCPLSQAYDPWKGLCRDVFCEDFSEITDNLILNCPLKLSFPSNEFIVGKTGNVTIIDSILPIPLDSYQIINETLLVCADNLLVEKFGIEYGYLSLALMIICIISLCSKLILDTLTPPSQQRSAQMITCFSLALLLASALLFFGQTQVENKYICTSVGVAIHYFYLASFFWLNVLAFDIWRTFSFRKLKSSKINFKNNSIYSWISPLLFVGVGLVLEFVDFGKGMHGDLFKPKYGKIICWISNKLALFMLFALPLLLIMIANMFFFLFTVICIITTRQQTKIVSKNSKHNTNDYLLFLQLAIMMGLTWLFGFLAAFLDIGVFWYSFTILNNLLGPFVLFKFWPKNAWQHLQVWGAKLFSFRGQLNKRSKAIVTKL